DQSTAAAGQSLPAAASGGAGLSLSRAVPARPAGGRPTSVQTQPFPAPGIGEVTELNLQVPMLRLNGRQSAIGTLIVTGASAVTWESSTHITGALTADGHFAGTPVETSGNRSLVGYAGRDAVVTLRHVRELRRALFIGRGPATLGAQIFDGASFTLPPRDGNRMFILSLLRVDNLLEMRAEPVPAGITDQDIWQEFGFSMTRRVTLQGNRGR
ncbi:MAG: hypothetical protein M3021_05225, partial [Actinomycetota bacterium]|nr:hypothetical protein [Actinomycetota bacterium]